MPRFRIVWHNPGYVVAELDAETLDDARERVMSILGTERDMDELHDGLTETEYVRFFEDRSEDSQDEEGEVDAEPADKA